MRFLCLFIDAFDFSTTELPRISAELVYETPASSLED
ncbi:unnamed protein product [Larinioides sclopetarius]|uniref:Uncharacterized protein n=1 Tax=Larinioides sclopetarius TaxID=280406 RepID=A0AAV1ZHL9_9ARAC